MGPGVPEGPQSADLAKAGRSCQGGVPEGFPLVEVAEMDLHPAHPGCGEGIPQGHAGVGQAPGIEDAPIDPLVTPGMDTVDQGAFVVALEIQQVRVPGFGQFPEPSDNIPKGAGAVDAGFPFSQAVQVGAVEQCHSFHPGGWWQGAALKKRRKKQGRPAEAGPTLSM